jgi:resuscitation-promoting factor RpfA
MPSKRRWSVPQRRIITSAALALIGTFLACGGLGMDRWSVGAVGIAIIAVGGAIVVLSAFNSRAMSEVEGTAHVVSRSAPPTGVTQGRCRLELIVSARGIDSVTVKTREPAVPVSKWPDRGEDLPVMVAIDNPQRTRVLWHLVPTHAELATERMRDRGRTGSTPPSDEYFVDEQDVYGADLMADLDSTAAEQHADGPSTVVPDEDADAMAASVGTRTIEMDVMDPSLMRWSEPPQTRPRRPPGSRPSPRRRRDQERVPTDEWEAGPPRDEAPVDAEVIDEFPVPPERADASANEPPDEEAHADAPPTKAAQPDEPPAEPPSDEARPDESPPNEPPDEEAQTDGSAADDKVAMSSPGDEAAVMPNTAAASGRVDHPVDTDRPAVPRSRAEGPELAWPLTSAAAAAHRWDYADDQDEPVDEARPGAQSPGGHDDRWFTSETRSTRPRVPRNRPAPYAEVDGGIDGEDVFDTRDDGPDDATEPGEPVGQDVIDDGPGYSRGPGYRSDIGYDDDTRYNPGTDYA